MNTNNLKDMYGSTPDSFKRSITEALEKTEAKQPMKKRISMRTVLVTALLVLLISAVALAATMQWKLQDFFTQNWGTFIPKAGIEVLEQSETKTYTLGRVKFTLQESIADGHLIYFSTHVESLDKNVILFPMALGDSSLPLPDSILELYDLEKGTTIFRAAQEKQLKVYGVSVYPEIVEDGTIAGDDMLDDHYQPDGSLVLINQLPLKTDTLEQKIGYNYNFQELFPEPAEDTPNTRLSETDVLTLPVQQALAVRTFTVKDGPIPINDGVIQSVTLTQKVTGIYATMRLNIGGERDDNALHEMYYARTSLLNDEGEYYPIGINLSGALDFDNYPDVVFMWMISLDTMPDHINIGVWDGDQKTIHTLTDYVDET
ncbi:MAG: hypothetical protein GX096_11175 [Clostridiales bacterium]|nr:hypothetical protein [Clostridiales bacterium]